MIRIGNAQGFWGDSVGAGARLVRELPDLNYLTLDYLAEVSMSILAVQREKDPELGFAEDFIEEIRSLIPFWQEGLKFKVVANAGGLNPLGCKKRVLEVLQTAGLSGLRVGVVHGDNVLSLLDESSEFSNLDTGEPLKKVKESLVSANAYLGAMPVAKALGMGADIVITGRVADPSLTVACALHHFSWKPEDYDKIAMATVAGHLIECGTQVTGGISTDWLEVPDPADMGYPIIEMEPDGTFVVTKPQNSGGCVTMQTVKEQLLYEIGDPDNYLSPDATVSFLKLTLEDAGKDRIRVLGAVGRPPPSTYKVSATYRLGYMAEGALTLFGANIREKAYRLGEVVIQRVKNRGFDLERCRVECIGGGDVVPGLDERCLNLKEGVLRIAVADSRKEAVLCFTKELVPLVTSGAQGTTGYFGGRPCVRRMFGFWPCLIAAKLVKPEVSVEEVS